jgi:N-acetylmuramoyl-L-alanine amidase
MTRTARLVLTGAVLWFGPAQASGAVEANGPLRAAPTRPGVSAGAGTTASAATGIPGRKIGGVECVALADAAAALGLRLGWVEPGRKAVLTGNGVKAEVEAEGRDIKVNGLRVFPGDSMVSFGGQIYVSRVDFERCLAPMLRPGYGVAPRLAPRVIALDAGHGGNDPGKVNPRLGINEKTLTLDVARRTARLLEAGGYRVVLTREDDSFVALPQRAATANIARADAFVSIHFNALINDAKTGGVEVFTFAPRFQRSTNAAGLGARNDAESHASPVNQHDHWSVVLAQAIHRRFVNDLRTADRGKKLMHLAVLRPLQCPGVLVECGFLTSDAEARKIATPGYRQQLAEALAAGIRDYAAALEGGKVTPEARR